MDDYLWRSSTVSYLKIILSFMVLFSFSPDDVTITLRTSSQLFRIMSTVSLHQLVIGTKYHEICHGDWYCPSTRYQQHSLWTDQFTLKLPCWWLSWVSNDGWFQWYYVHIGSQGHIARWSSALSRTTIEEPLYVSIIQYCSISYVPIFYHKNALLCLK